MCTDLTALQTVLSAGQTGEGRCSQCCSGETEQVATQLSRVLKVCRVSQCRLRLSPVWLCLLSLHLCTCESTICVLVPVCLCGCLSVCLDSFWKERQEQGGPPASGKG